MQPATFALLLVIAVVVAVVVLRSRRPAAAPDPREADPVHRERSKVVAGGVGVRDIAPGAVVAFDGRDWLVRGTLTFDEDGFIWHEHLLDDATTKRWLSVEDDEGDLEVALWEAVPGTGPEPGPASIEHGGVTYRLDEHGTARYSASGSTGTPATGQVEYWDYEAGDLYLGFERYSGSTWEMAAGRRLQERGIDVFPASTT